MKALFFILLPVLMLLAQAACSSPKIEENQFKDTRELRQSSLFKRGLIPERFVDILPPSVQDINYQSNSADTISHMYFRLTRLPDDYFALISRMESVMESEIARKQPFEPEGAAWWDAEKVRANFDRDSFVFRKLPMGVGDAVYIATNESGEVFAWIDQ